MARKAQNSRGRDRRISGESTRKRVEEARVQYDEAPRGRAYLPLGKSRLSAKNQITIPAYMVRALDMRPGDEIGMMVHNGKILLERLPRTPDEWIEHLSGSIHAREWSTKEKIDAWINAERDSWDRGWKDDRPPLSRR